MDKIKSLVWLNFRHSASKRSALKDGTELLTFSNIEICVSASRFLSFHFLFLVPFDFWRILVWPSLPIPLKLVNFNGNDSFSWPWREHLINSSFFNEVSFWQDVCFSKDYTMKKLFRKNLYQGLQTASLYAKPKDDQMIIFCVSKDLVLKAAQCLAWLERVLNLHNFWFKKLIALLLDHCHRVNIVQWTCDCLSFQHQWLQLGKIILLQLKRLWL